MLEEIFPSLCCSNPYGIGRRPDIVAWVYELETPLNKPALITCYKCEGVLIKYSNGNLKQVVFKNKNKGRLALSPTPNTVYRNRVWMKQRDDVKAKALLLRAQREHVEQLKQTLDKQQQRLNILERVVHKQVKEVK